MLWVVVHRPCPDIQIVKLLLQYDPLCARLTTTNGNTALHWVVTHIPPSEEITTCLVNIYPEGIHIKNNAQMTPLDILQTNFDCKGCQQSRILLTLISKLTNHCVTNAIIRQDIFISSNSPNHYRSSTIS